MSYNERTGPNGRLMGNAGEMSVRADRYYRLLHLRGIYLREMSTDQDVLRYLPRLQALRQELEGDHGPQWLDGYPPGCTQVWEWDALIRDVDAIMRRLPSERTS